MFQQTAFTALLVAAIAISVFCPSWPGAASLCAAIAGLVCQAALESWDRKKSPDFERLEKEIATLKIKVDQLILRRGS